jgi:hypothetical protein
VDKVQQEQQDYKVYLVRKVHLVMMAQLVLKVQQVMTVLLALKE